MLFNFCDPSLRPEIHTETISTEGYEVTNLISNNDKGFLAYSCIKPPVNIDITFLCNIRINHILIWPSVGPQKSSGFRLYAKSSNDINISYSLLSYASLSSSESGILFYPANVNCEKISVPDGFSKHVKMSLGHITMYTNSLRLCIFKTENSVPALGKIEVWGTVSPRCGKDVVASVHALWMEHQSLLFPKNIPATSATQISPINSVADDVNNKNTIENLQVPEDFLDAITWEIMTQPVILPSGNIIDQSTLQKHEENEALWGRIISDPFTGVPFNEKCKPIIATTLKMQIDKFLLEHCDSEEIKKLPRPLGHKSVCVTIKNNKLPEIPKHTVNESPKTNNFTTENNSRKRKRHCHQLPYVICPKQSTANISKPAELKKTADINISLKSNKFSEEENKIEVTVNGENNTDDDIQKLLSNIKRFSTPKESDPSDKEYNCVCCSKPIFYKLPCKHIACRRVLTTSKECRCKICESTYKKNEVERIYM